MAILLLGRPASSLAEGTLLRWSKGLAGGAHELLNGFYFEVSVVRFASGGSDHQSFNFNLNDKLVDREQLAARLAQEKRMSKSAIRFFTLAICATSLVMVPMVDPAKAASTSSKKHKRHVQWSPGYSGPWYAGQALPVARSPGPVCPGIGRSFDCKVWPPPFDEDPDRKTSGSDAGG
jgi:hypothetical protein